MCHLKASFCQRIYQGRREILIETLSGYIPDFEYEIPEHTLRAEAKVDLAESMEKVDDRIRQSEVSLARLKDQGVDVSELEDELDQVKAAYDDTYEMIDTDEKAVNGYIDYYFDIETAIIQIERQLYCEIKRKEELEIINVARKFVTLFGTKEEEELFNTFEGYYSDTEANDQKEFQFHSLQSMGIAIAKRGFEKMKSLFATILENGETPYVNIGQAKKLVLDANQAIENMQILSLQKSMRILASILTNVFSDETIHDG